MVRGLRCVHGRSLTSGLGPFAFMDIFDPAHICNHSDQEGRYAYKVTFPQCYFVACVDAVVVPAPARNDVSAPACAAVLRAHYMNSLFSMRALLMALAPLVGAESELGDRALSEGWAKEAKRDKISQWNSKGVVLVDEELKALFRREYEAEYNEKMRRVCLRHGSVNPRIRY
jgi:Protein adenylyltransferase SelO